MYLLLYFSIVYLISPDAYGVSQNFNSNDLALLRIPILYFNSFIIILVFQ